MIDGNERYFGTLISRVDELATRDELSRRRLLDGDGEMIERTVLLNEKTGEY
jgi:hypothetical protein